MARAIGRGPGRALFFPHERQLFVGWIHMFRLRLPHLFAPSGFAARVAAVFLTAVMPAAKEEPHCAPGASDPPDPFPQRSNIPAKEKI